MRKYTLFLPWDTSQNPGTCFLPGKKRLRQLRQVEKSLYGYQGPRDPSGYEGPKFDQKMIFSEWLPLVGKMIPDLVGVFWDHLGVCTMDFWDPRGCAMIFPRIFPSLL